MKNAKIFMMQAWLQLALVFSLNNSLFAGGADLIYRCSNEKKESIEMVFAYPAGSYANSAKISIKTNAYTKLNGRAELLSGPSGNAWSVYLDYCVGKKQAWKCGSDNMSPVLSLYLKNDPDTERITGIEKMVLIIPPAVGREFLNCQKVQ